MSLLPQAICPSMIGVILFTSSAAAICGGAGTEASFPTPFDAEVDATDRTRADVQRPSSGPVQYPCPNALSQNIGSPELPGLSSKNSIESIDKRWFDFVSNTPRFDGTTASGLG